MDKPKEIIPYEKLPDDAPMFYCFGCQYAVQPVEIPAKWENRCPHCAQKLEETTKGGIQEARMKRYGIKMPKATKELKKTPK